MLISIEWLKQYVDIPWGVQQLADRLTQIGIKVEKIEAFEHDLEGVVVGRIESVEPHKVSDGNLHVCAVDVGESTVKCVTGAPNVESDLVVPVALPGAKLPGGPGTVREIDIAGIKSEAVVCSEKELGLSDDHTGLMVLPPDVEIGTPVTEALGLDDVVLELETYPNRPDCLSVVGIAREVAAMTHGEVRLPSFQAKEVSDKTTEDFAQVDVKNPDLCLRYTARIVTGVTVQPSPAWMQQRLRAVGMRPINNVVDVTNYCLMELGQPLHAFDYDLLEGGQIIVRMAENGETLTTLDGETHQLHSDTLVICDETRPVALAGIMGGLDTEVTSTTKTILLESATFDPVSVRKTAKKLGVSTESSYRFERNLDPHLSGQVLERAANLLAELSGGEVASGRIDVVEKLPKPKVVTGDPDRINRLLGTKLSPMEMKRILKGLGFEVDILHDSAGFEVKVPTYRRDIGIEADIAEEIARLYGFDQIPSTLPKGATLLGGLSDNLAHLDHLRRELVRCGLFESITYSFIAPDMFDRMQIPDDHPWRHAIDLSNPISEEHQIMRTTLLPSLLQAAGTNFRRQVADVRLFELGKVYVADELPPTALPREMDTLTIVMAGGAPTNVWGFQSRNIDFFDMKGVVESISDSLQLRFRYVAAEHPSFHPGRTATLLVEAEDGAEVEVGLLGEIHPNVAEAFEIKGRVYAAEMNLDTLFSLEKRPFEFTSIPRYPAVSRDLAVVVATEVRAEAVLQVIRSTGGDNLVDVRLFDVYEGDQIPAGSRSLAFSLTYQAADRTLTDDEITEQQRQIEEALSTQFDAELRQ